MCIYIYLLYTVLYMFLLKHGNMALSARVGVTNG